MPAPRVSVLMPVYNGEKYLSQAIASVLGQTYQDFELIIIDDGSSDQSWNIAASFADKRIRLVQNERNLGLVATLNRGIDLARGEYLARMDSDDICLSSRLHIQVGFMDRHPTVGVCGTWAAVFSEKGTNYVRKMPVKSAVIRCELFFNSAVVHPSVIMRKTIFADMSTYYDHNYSHAEDYELWTRIVDKVEFGNIPIALLKYRLNDSQISNVHKSQQMYSAQQVRTRLLAAIGITPTDAQSLLHSSFAVGNYEASQKYLEELDEWLLRIIAGNNETGFFDRRLFAKRLAKSMTDAFIHVAKVGLVDSDWLKKSRFFQPFPLLSAERLYLTKRYLRIKLGGLPECP